MRILIATGVYPPETGGPATYTKLLEERLPAYGFTVSVLPFRAVRKWPRGIRHAAYFLKCFAMARRADIVYAQDTVSVGLPAALASRLARKKFVVRVPGDYAWEQGVRRFGITDDLNVFQHKRYGARVEFLRSIQKFVIRRAIAVVTPSEYMKGIVRRWNTPRTQVIYSSIELPPHATPPQNRPEGFLVVSSGRRVPWKGFEALEQVVAREKDWHLFIAENLPREQALGWVQAADVFVINSTYEGLSHALVEAMSLGTPVIATDVGGNPELIDDGVNGLLVPAGNADELYDALKAVHDDPRAAKARAETARATLGRFSIDQTLGVLATMLNEL